MTPLGLGQPWIEPSADNPLVISSSSLAEFVRCRKAYEISYEWGRETLDKPEAMERGTSLHKMLEMFNNVLRGTVKMEEILSFKNDAMYPVFEAYLKHKGLPHYREHVAEVLMVEEPIFVQMFPHVYMRVTLDAVERLKTGEICGVDYKSFNIAATWDTDLDFQARLYSAVLERKYPGELCQFEHRKIRQMPPNVPRNATEQTKADEGKSFKVWSESECYEDILTIYHERELQVVWEETKWKILDLMRARQEGRFYRIEPSWRQGPGSCASCMQRRLCVAEVKETLDDALINGTSTLRKPLVVDPSQLLKVS